MNPAKKRRPMLDHHVGCFGDFNPEDQICITHCALCIRCAVENDQLSKMEILEELFFAETANVKLQ